jgi:hypothetical protein
MVSQAGPYLQYAPCARSGGSQYNGQRRFTNPPPQKCSCLIHAMFHLSSTGGGDRFRDRSMADLAYRCARDSGAMGGRDPLTSRTCCCGSSNGPTAFAGAATGVGVAMAGGCSGTVSKHGVFTAFSVSFAGSFASRAPCAAAGAPPSEAWRGFSESTGRSRDDAILRVDGRRPSCNADSTAFTRSVSVLTASICWAVASCCRSLACRLSAASVAASRSIPKPTSARRRLIKVRGCSWSLTAHAGGIEGET